MNYYGKLNNYLRSLKPETLISIAVGFGLLFIVLVAIGVVPINMDESSQYHVISCDFYENAKYHIFREPCDGSYNLDFLGIQLKRSYAYIGSLSSYLYYPFFMIFPYIITQKVVGIIFIILILRIILSLEKNNRKSVLIIFGLSFPLIYQILNDTGPVRYGLLITLFTPYFVQIILRCERKYLKKIYNIVLGFLLFIAVEDKTFFLYLLPSITLLTLAYNPDESKQNFIASIRLLIKELWIAICVFSLCALAYLFLSKNNVGQIYFFELIQFKEELKIQTVKYLLKFFTNFQQFSHRVYSDLDPQNDTNYQTRKLFVVNTILSLSIWGYGIAALVAIYRKKVDMFSLKKVTYTLLAFIVNLAILIFTQIAWAGHHFIYSYVLGLLVICQSIPFSTIRIKNQFFILYSLFSLFLTIQLFFFIPASHSSWERYKIFDYLKQEAIAREYIITHLNWGTYYVSALYGNKEQLVIYTEPLDSETATKVINLSEETKRKILCICHGSDCNSNKLSDSFLKKIKFKEVYLSNDHWRLYLEESRTES